MGVPVQGSVSLIPLRFHLVSLTTSFNGAGMKCWGDVPIGKLIGMRTSEFRVQSQSKPRRGGAPINCCWGDRNWRSLNVLACQLVDLQLQWEILSQKRKINSNEGRRHPGDQPFGLHKHMYTQIQTTSHTPKQNDKFWEDTQQMLHCFLPFQGPQQLAVICYLKAPYCNSDHIHNI